MIKADELYQEILKQNFSISDINKAIRELESIKNTITDSSEYKLFDGKVSEFVEAFNMFKDFYNSDSNEYIRKTESKNSGAKMPKGLLPLTKFDYIYEYIDDAILSFKKVNNSQRVKFPNIKTDFTKKTERNKNRKKHVNPEWLNDIIRERYRLIKDVEELQFKLVLDDEDAIYCCD